jgi:D-serine deaminase-like pyridoxal phosphate-dependent protein
MKGVRMENRPAVPAVSTPALMVDLDVFDANVAAMAGLLAGTGKKVRPHVKAHRTPELAKRQVGESVSGLTCATVGEAEAMVDAGLSDVLVANEVVDAPKIARLASLARRSAVMVAVDDPAPTAALARAAVEAGVEIGILVDVDTLLHRCGVETPEDAVALARFVAGQPGLRLRGVMGYEGGLRITDRDRSAKLRGAYTALAAAADAIRKAGLPVDIVSAAGTSTLREAIADPAITEIQAGVYALMEPELLIMDLPFRCASWLRGTVISRHPGRVVTNVGRRVVGVEYGPPTPVGFDVKSIAVSDEHTTLFMGDPLPELGSTVDLTPGQIRTTFNLHDHIWVTRNGALVDRWPIARGSSQ